MTQDENQMPTNKSSKRNFTKQQSQEEQYSNVVDLKSRLSSTVNEESKTDLVESELPADDFDPIPF